MSVHYKFKNTLNYDAIKFDGVYIGASELKNKIVQQKKMGQSELKLENEDTGQTYSDDQQIPKNTKIIVVRLPFANNNKRTRQMANQPYPTRFANANSSGSTNQNHTNNNNHNHHHNHHHHHNNHRRHNHMNNNNNNSNNPTATSLASGIATSSSSTSSSSAANNLDVGGAREALELVSTKNMSEEEKIKHIQSQSTREFEPSHYARGGRGAGMGGPHGRGKQHFVPGPNYTCRKCGIPGHSIYDCKANTMHKVKRSSGIPRDFLVKVDAKEKGALMTPSGEYAMSRIDLEAYRNPKKERAPFFEDGTPSDQQLQTGS